MPTLMIEDEVFLRYEDSYEHGQEPTNYTTYIFIHGLAHDLRSFENLSKESTERRRIIRVNLRGYPGSSDLPEKIKAKYDHRESCVLHNQLCAKDVVNFVLHFAKKFKLERKSVQLIGWSQGTMPLVAIMTNPKYINEQKKTEFSSLILQLTLLDPPSVPYDVIPKVPIPDFDPFKFAEYVCGAHHHKYNLEGDVITTVVGKDLSNRRPAHEFLFNSEVMPVLTGDFFDIDPEESQVIIRSALRGESGLADIPAALIYASNSVIECEICGEWISKVTRGGARRWNILRVDGANHFFIYDEPEATWSYLDAVQVRQKFYFGTQ